MIDYNFFEGYSVKKPRSSIGVRLFNIAFLLVLMLLGVYMGFNYYLIIDQRNELLELDTKINELKSTDDIARIYSKQELLEELKSIVSNMEAAGDDINHSSIIDEDLLVTLADALPSDVRINNLLVSGNGITMSGEAISKPAIAEFEYNLRSIPSFSDMFINGIQRISDENFTFSISLNVGGGTDEN